MEFNKKALSWTKKASLDEQSAASHFPAVDWCGAVTLRFSNENGPNAVWKSLFRRFRFADNPSSPQNVGIIPCTTTLTTDPEAMPQTSPPQRAVRSRVSGGVPWWLWTIMTIIIGGVGYSVITNSIPVDADQLYKDAMAAAGRNDGVTLKKNSELLKQFPDRVPQQKILEAINWMGTSRPLKAIPLLKEAAEDPASRLEALKLLGAAYAAATDRKSAIATFESVLKVDPDAHEARVSIARILVDCLAWEEALQHLNHLAEQKHLLPHVLQMRAEIRMTLGQYAEAATDYEQSIAADETDPTNGLKATKLVQCFIHTANYKKISEYVDRVDNPQNGVVAKAEVHLSENRLNEALDVMDEIRRENPYDAAVLCVYGRVMRKHNTPEKAVEAVAVLRPALKMATRDVDLYRVFVELARAAGETELASLAQQNVDQLDVLEKEFNAALANVIRNRDGIEDRLALAGLAKQLERFEFTSKIFEGLNGYYPEREHEFNAHLQAMMVPNVQLVSTGSEEPPVISGDGGPDGGSPPGLLLSPPLLDPAISPLPETDTPGSSTPKPDAPR